MISYRACKESLSIIRIYKLIKYKLKFNREHPEYFDPDGLVVFTGAQGTGKTLSAVNYVENLMKLYPKAKLVTNLMLKNYPIVTFKDYVKEKIATAPIEFLEKYTGEELRKILQESYLEENRVFKFENGEDLGKYNNGEYGVVFLIDEIQLYFNSLKSKNINPEVMVQISQQRKQRKHIVSTSQVFGRMAKPLREQFSSVIVCKKILGCLQINKLIDRDSISENEDTTGTTLKGEVKKRFFWFHSPVDYGKYDTYYVIKQNDFVSEEEKKIGIYGTEQSISINSKEG